MTTIALSCGNVDRVTRSGEYAAEWVDVPAPPGKQDIDPLLDWTDERLVVHGTDADLAAVVLRLLRRTRLDLTVGYVPVAASPVTRLWGFEPGDAARAFTASPRPTPLIRDDSGGVVLGSARIEPVLGQVYCDDQRMLDGDALRVEVAPDPSAAPLEEPTSDPLSTELRPAEDGVRVTVVRRRLLLRRRTTARGRAVQAAFRSSTVVRDGIEHPRRVQKWGWYRHTEDLFLAC